jgi:hypothetical protein
VHKNDEKSPPGKSTGRSNSLSNMYCYNCCKLYRKNKLLNDTRHLIASNSSQTFGLSSSSISLSSDTNNNTLSKLHSTSTNTSAENSPTSTKTSLGPGFNNLSESLNLSNDESTRATTLNESSFKMEKIEYL